ncbi:hypothetical protein [Streptomyces iconiensis]|uniref:SPOR domain-containing protein n=1 Tax=Streptomyces iconiensis TaxID=1384038 RepID=A0ABT6ZMW6_9ACTN|nr:hypothetical protein [Streptomyces iconiensis]MDJ1130390.1 hypothetical protein [Streptomyces iconiensis]
MPDDVGGQPFPDGEEPDSRDHGAADEEFASVVLDEDFVRAAEVHEPTATERMLAAAQSHAESDLPRILEEGFGHGAGEGEFPHDGDSEDAEDDPEDGEGRFDRSDYDLGYGVPAELADADDMDLEGRPGGPSAFGPFPAPGIHGEAYAGGFPPGLDSEYEHGADYGYAYGAYGASGRFGGPYGAHGAASRPYRGHGSWQRPIAWVLAVVMGIGMVALAFTAVYRGASNQRQDPAPPPATTGVEPTGAAVPGALPSVSADTGAPTASAEPPDG